jgi:iron complex transport system ATP-binding protein
MILEIKNLSFHYNTSDTIFSNVNFTVDKGEVLSILGPNGAGKSTLLNCIANLFTPSSGEIILNEESIVKMGIRNVARIVGYVPQLHTPTFAYSVLEFTVMGRTPYIGAFATPSPNDYRIAQEALERMKITHLRNKPYTELSGGERQQVTIARVIAQQPQLILMDEPTAHLDYGNQYRVVQMIRELADEGYAIIITTHNPEHAIILYGNAAIFNRERKFSIGKNEETRNS